MKSFNARLQLIKTHALINTQNTPRKVIAKHISNFILLAILHICASNMTTIMYHPATNMNTIMRYIPDNANFTWHLYSLTIINRPTWIDTNIGYWINTKICKTTFDLYWAFVSIHHAHWYFGRIDK